MKSVRQDLEEKLALESKIRKVAFDSKSSWQQSVEKYLELVDEIVPELVALIADTLEDGAVTEHDKVARKAIKKANSLLKDKKG